MHAAADEVVVEVAIDVVVDVVVLVSARTKTFTSHITRGSLSALESFTYLPCFGSPVQM